MRRFRVLVDCDGVLADFVTPVLKVIEEESGEPHPYPTVWDFIAQLEPNLQRKVKRRIREPGFCEVFNVYPGAYEAMETLRKWAEVYIVTSPFGGSPTWMYERENWLAARFEIKSSQVVHTSAKHIIRADVLIEDKAAALHEWRAADLNNFGILFDRPYNREQWDGHTARTWPEVIEIVRRLP